MEALIDTTGAMPATGGIDAILPYVDNLLSLALLVVAVLWFMKELKARNAEINKVQSDRLDDLKAVQAVLQSTSAEMLKHGLSVDALKTESANVREEIVKLSALVREKCK